MKKKMAPSAPDTFLQGHFLRADPAPLSFKTRRGGGGRGGVAYKDPARLPPPGGWRQHGPPFSEAVQPF